MLGNHGLLQPNSPDEPASYYNSTLESREDIDKFVSKLSSKKLRLRNLRGQFFYRTPFDLFAAIFDGGRGDAAKIQRELKNFVLRFPTWSDLLPELAFLETNQKVLLYFMRYPDKIIFSGLCLLLLAVIFKVQLKVYQLYQRKSLMSFEVGAGIKTAQSARIGVFVFADAISFALLDKVSGPGNAPLDALLENLRSNNTKFETKFEKIEQDIVQTLTENMGVFSQMLIDFTDYSLRVQRVQRERNQIIEILGGIKQTIAPEAREGASGRVLRIENLGLDRLSPAAKVELIFGPKKAHEILIRADQPAHLPPGKPPGLNNKYTEAMPLFSHPTLEGFERVESINVEAKRTPDTGEGSTRKHSFEAMVAIPEQAEEHVGPVRPIVLEENRRMRFSGTLKFVNEKEQYGFFLKDVDRSDVFFHFSELEQANIPLKLLLDNKTTRVTFAEVLYIGRHKKSKKAVDIELVA